MTKYEVPSTRYEIRGTNDELGDTRYEIRGTNEELRGANDDGRMTRYELRSTYGTDTTAKRTTRPLRTRYKIGDELKYSNQWAMINARF